MAFEIIVFSQKELDNALESGFISIALCDGRFVLPKVGNISYTAIGSVNAKADGTKKAFEEHNVTFDGFLPKFADDVPITAFVPTGSSGSSASSMPSSYFVTSYIYEYEYEAGSFLASYSASFSASFSSFMTSFRTRYGGECMMVNGYGINLI